jgi:hypothetical protein
MVEVPGYFSFKNDQYFRKKQIPLSSLLTFKMSFCKNDGSVKMLLVKSDLKTVVKDLIARNRMRTKDFFYGQYHFYYFVHVFYFQQ